MPSPSLQPATRRSSRLTLIGSSAEVKLRLSMMQEWFSRQSLASCVSMVIFVVALLLGLMAKHHWSTKHLPETKAPPAVTPVPGPVKPASPATEPTAPPPPFLAREELPAWLTNDSRIFVFVTSDFTHFELPMDLAGPFRDLIQRFNKGRTYPKDFQLSVNTDTWNARTGRNHECHSPNPQAFRQDQLVEFFLRLRGFFKRDNKPGGFRNLIFRSTSRIFNSISFFSSNQRRAFPVAHCQREQSAGAGSNEQALA